MADKIFENDRYIVHKLRGPCLCVQNKLTKKEKVLRGEKAQEWIESIQNSVDYQESVALCRAFLA